MPLSHAELGQRMVDGGAGVWSAAKWATYWAAPKEEQEAMDEARAEAAAKAGIAAEAFDEPDYADAEILPSL